MTGGVGVFGGIVQRRQDAGVLRLAKHLRYQVMLSRLPERLTGEERFLPVND